MAFLLVRRLTVALWEQIIRFRIDDIQLPSKFLPESSHHRECNRRRIITHSNDLAKLGVSILVLRILVPRIKHCIPEEALGKVNEENLV